MKNSLQAKQKSYEDAYDFKILNKIPIIVRVDGRNFSKITQTLKKPFDISLSNAMQFAMLETSKQMETNVFSYHQDDEISFVLYCKQNEDQEWFGNKIQKIGANTASMVTYYFQSYIKEHLTLNVPTFFDCIVFGVPSAYEAINNIISRQQICFQTAVIDTSNFIAKNHSENALKKLSGKKIIERIEYLRDENFDFFSLPFEYYKGVAAYKAPKVSAKESGISNRTKWILDNNIPDLSKDRMFLLNILNSGSDILRPERDLNF